MSGSIGDLGMICTLVLQLHRDYETAPAGGTELANDLESLHASLSEFLVDGSPDSLLNRSTEEKDLHLPRILKQVQGIVKELQRLGERHSHIDGSQSRIWDGSNFPGVQIKALRARIHIQTSLLILFMTGLSSATLLRIEEILTDRVQRQQVDNGVNSSPDNDNTWRALLDAMERSGIEREALSPHKVSIMRLIDALSEVDQTAYESSKESESTIAPPQAEPFHQQRAVVGPPTAAQVVLSLCPGAVMLQEKRAGAVKLVRKFFLGYNYQIKCEKCHFSGSCNRKLDDLAAPTNTPLFFKAREKVLEPTSLEYHYEIHTQNRDKQDGLYYRTLFFWKCHVPASRQTFHHGGYYQCMFCPLERTFANIYSRDELLEHIRMQHVQNPPSRKLREKFNCWIDERPALFGGQEEKLVLLKFDLLLPKAFEETETRFAMVQMNQAKQGNQQ